MYKIQPIRVAYQKQGIWKLKIQRRERRALIV